MDKIFHPQSHSYAGLGLPWKFGLVLFSRSWDIKLSAGTGTGTGMGTHCDYIENLSPSFCLIWLGFGSGLGWGLSIMGHCWHLWHLNWVLGRFATCRAWALQSVCRHLWHSSYVLGREHRRIREYVGIFVLWGEAPESLHEPLWEGSCVECGRKRYIMCRSDWLVSTYILKIDQIVILQLV